jgi:hypothetical protein
LRNPYSRRAPLDLIEDTGVVRDFDIQYDGTHIYVKDIEHGIARDVTYTGLHLDQQTIDHHINRYLDAELEEIKQIAIENNISNSNFHSFYLNCVRSSTMPDAWTGFWNALSNQPNISEIELRGAPLLNPVPNFQGIRHHENPCLRYGDLGQQFIRMGAWTYNTTVEPIADINYDFYRAFRQLNIPGATLAIPSQGTRKFYLLLMPFSNYHACAKCFADRELKCMRVNVLRVLKYLAQRSYRHRIAAAEMWRGYEQSLIRYGLAIAVECIQRGFTDKTLSFFKDKHDKLPHKKPSWVFWPELNSSHKSYLLMLEERRSAIQIFHRCRKNPQPCGLIEFCERVGLPTKRHWPLSILETMKQFATTLNVDTSTTGVYDQYGWSETAKADIKYPRAVECSL